MYNKIARAILTHHDRLTDSILLIINSINPVDPNYMEIIINIYIVFAGYALYLMMYRPVKSDIENNENRKKDNKGKGEDDANNDNDEINFE
jgi:hypothetical protein